MINTLFILLKIAGTKYMTLINTLRDNSAYFIFLPVGPKNSRVKRDGSYLQIEKLEYERVMMGETK